MIANVHDCIHNCLKNGQEWKILGKIDKIKKLHSKTAKKNVKKQLYEIPKLRYENCIKRVEIEKRD